MLSHQQATSSVPRRAIASPLHHNMLSMSNKDADARFQQALEQIESLRNEPISKAIDEALSARLESGTNQEDSSSLFALLSSQIGFWPTSLVTGSAVPLFATIRHPKYAHIPDLFQFLLQGEILAGGASLLLDCRRDDDDHETLQQDQQHAVLFDDDGDSIDLPFPYKISPLAQAFPTYTDRMDGSHKRAACAAACAVVFPRWARICQRLLLRTQASKKNYCEDNNEQGGSATPLLKFFNTSVEEIDEMAAAIMMQEDLKTCSYHDMSNHVRLLQEYEMLFWDATDIIDIVTEPKHSADSSRRPLTARGRRSSFARTA